MYSKGSVLVVQGCCELIRRERRDEKTTDRVGVVSIGTDLRASVKATSRFALKPMSEFENSNGYQREVLGVRTSVAVLLAHKAVPLSLILDLVPGAMIQFNKNCDAPLVLEVGGHPLAVGEAVKVEDKFGLRVRTFNVTEEDL
jgi:flagellar motor switch protein FliN/FliY